MFLIGIQDNDIYFFRGQSDRTRCAVCRLQVAFDAVARGTRFGRKCPSCGEYQSVTGATPVVLSSDLPSDRVARTDLEFGSDDEKAPLFVAGDDAAARLTGLKLSGCRLVRQ
jgi:NAD-dependent SIR2 family protein deacetylase